MTKTTNLVSQLARTAAATNDIRDIKPPVDIPSGWAWVWWALAALAGATLLFLAWRYWQKCRTFVPAPVVIPPHVRARQKLAEALALIGLPEPFVVAVSSALRVYLEERFEFRAPERTTEEFLHELGDTPLLSARQKQSLGDFLTRCDLVKFAKYRPGELELRELHGSALRLVEETEPTVTAPTDSTGQSAIHNPQSVIA
jgi:hypothetical protein